MSTITAALVVFNEEERIEGILRSLTWCDEIVVLDKSSTDRTREIAARYTHRIVTAPYSGFDIGVLHTLRDESSSEWILWVYASDLVTPALAKEVRRLISGDVPYDVIEVPYRRFVLGIGGVHSPWHGNGFHPSIIRRSAVAFRDDDVHGAIASNSERIHRMQDAASDAYLYHLTHPSIDMMMDRHLRYCRADGVLSSERLSLRRAAASVLRSVFDVVVRRRTVFHGWDGVALSFAWVSYWMLRYLYVWERKRSRAPDLYARMRREILAEWEKTSE
jgi:glycosyltransferase involved in cell wall biosynthesis